MVHLPPAEYYATLPKQICAAGVIVRDEHNRVLVVQTTYGAKLWELPGGGLEEGEYPLDAARREVKEELGLDLEPGRLLVVDWVPPQPDGRPALTNYLFDGGILSHAEFAALRLSCGELKRWTFVTPAEYADLLPPHMARRVDVCLDAVGNGKTAYLQHGFSPTEG